MPKLLTQVLLLRPQSGRILIGMVAGFMSEWWPASAWNTRPDNVGIRTHRHEFGADPVLFASDPCQQHHRRKGGANQARLG